MLEKLGEIFFKEPFSQSRSKLQRIKIQISFFSFFFCTQLVKTTCISRTNSVSFFIFRIFSIRNSEASKIVALQLAADRLTPTTLEDVEGKIDSTPSYSPLSNSDFDKQGFMFYLWPEISAKNYKISEADLH